MSSKQSQSGAFTVTHSHTREEIKRAERLATVNNQTNDKTVRSLSSGLKGGF